MNDLTKIEISLERIAEALERLSPALHNITLSNETNSFVWQTDPDQLIPAISPQNLTLDLLKGIDSQKARLFNNTLQYAKGYPANNALLWGARGTGKSSLIKSVIAAINSQYKNSIALIEIQREDITSLPRLLRQLSNTKINLKSKSNSHSKRRIILFCDDLSFENQDENYKSLKSILDGSVDGITESVLFYATSNRRHMMSRKMIENEQDKAIHQGETIDEKVSLSDRFGLWIGFHNMDQETYLAIVRAYVECVNITINQDDLRARALAWSVSRGARSGRVAWQFFLDLCGQNNINAKL